MNLLGLSLALGAAFAFTGFDVTRKQVSQHIGAFALAAWLALGSLPFLGAWALYTGIVWSPAWWGPGLGAVALQGGANLIFLVALKIAPLSRTVPFLALTPVLSAGGAWAILGETPSVQGLVGMVLVTAGAFALALERAPGDAGFRFEKGSLLAVLVATMWATGAVVDKAALEAANPPTHAFLTTAGMMGLGTVATVALQGPRAMRLPRVALPRLLASCFFGAAAMGLQLSALTFIQVSAVETVKRGVGGFAALVLGRVAFGETIHLRAVLAVAVMTIGTLLVIG